VHVLGQGRHSKPAELKYKAGLQEEQATVVDPLEEQVAQFGMTVVQATQL
jgi:hypothetical protein